MSHETHARTPAGNEPKHCWWWFVLIVRLPREGGGRCLGDGWDCPCCGTRAGTVGDGPGDGRGTVVDVGPFGVG